MTKNSKPIWSEGMFLRHQHFQQEERYLENYVNDIFAMLLSDHWGVAALAIDQQHLSLGRIVVNQARGLFPDGTPFDTDDNAVMQQALALDSKTHHQLIYLSLPLKGSNIADVDMNNQELLARHSSREELVHDSSSAGDQSACIVLGDLRLQLLREKDDRSQYTCVPICRVLEVRDDGGIMLDPDYIPPCVNCQASPKLSGYLRELKGTLQFRGEELASRVTNPNLQGLAVMIDFFLLQLINRYQAYISHLADKKTVPPQAFYEELLKFTGELSTYTTQNKRFVDYPRYEHQNLQQTFGKLMEILRHLLVQVLDKNVIPLKLQNSKQGIRVCLLNDKTLLSDCDFIVAAKADMSAENLRSRFASQVKIAPVEKIRDLISAQLPGISLESLPVAPSQIPYHSGYLYFKLNKVSPLWAGMQDSAGFAMYVSADMSNLELEFWAIKK